MKTFFVAGAPRSGTGFLSAFLTTESSLCFHEGLKFVKSRYTEFFQPFGKEAIGDAGAHISFIYKELIQEFPGSKFLILSRNETEVYRSASRIGLPTNDAFACIQSVAAMGRDTEIDVIHIPFELLFTEEAGRRIWEHCIGTPFDTDRWHILRRLNIQAAKQTHEETLDFVRSGVAKDFNQE